MSERTTWIGQGDFVYRTENPPVFCRSNGPYLYDTSERSYLDAEAANGTTLLGYDATLLHDAFAKIQDSPSLPSFCESDLRLEVAERLGLLIKQETGMKGRVSFETGGAQGIEFAIKIATLNTGKNQIVTFEGAYHGRSGFTSQLSASHRYRRLLGNWRIPVTRLPSPDPSTSCLPEQQWRMWYHERVDALLHDERCGVALGNGTQDVAAFLYEPVLNVAGMAMPDSAVLRHIVEEVRQVGGLIIADEIFCGMYRTGKLLGSALHGINPDILVLSKGLTNGLAPISCVWAREPLLDKEHVPPGTHSTTYMNNMLGLAVTSSVLDRHEQWTTRDRDIDRLQQSLAASIRRICAQSDTAQSGYAVGGLGRIVLNKPIATNIRQLASHPVGKNRRGLLLAATGMTPDIINMHPPINMTQEQIEECADLLEKTFINNL